MAVVDLVAANSGVATPDSVTILSPTTGLPVMSLSAGIGTSAATYAAARLLSGVNSGDRLQVLGRTSQSDGGQGLFTWVPGGTTTINDGYALQATGGIWQRTDTTIQAQWYGIDPTGVTASDVQLNVAIQDAIARKMPLIIPNGLFQLAAPLFCYSGSFSTLYMSGQGGTALGGGRVNFTYPGSKTNPNTMLWANFNNLPALIYNAVRDGVLSDLCILGNNLNTNGSFSTPFPPSLNPSDYVTNSCRDSRYSPYAGICFDPFNASTPADGGYPGMTYPQSSGAGSHGVLVRNVAFYGFVVGGMIGPTGTAANGDVITFRDCTVGYCRVGYASGESQARNLVITGGNASNCHCLFDTNTYGAQNAPPPQISDVQLGGSYALINFNGAVGAGRISGCHAETIMCIGRGGSPSGVGQPLLFESCDLTPFNELTYPGDTGPGCPPSLFTAGGPTRFNCCNFTSAGHQIEAWNLICNDGTAWIECDNCTFTGAIEAHRIPPIGIQRSRAGVRLRNCWVNGSGIGGQSQVVSDDLYRGNNALSVIWGNNIGRLNATCQTYRVPDSSGGGNNPNIEYMFVPGGGFQGGTITIGSVTAMTLNATTVTFTRTNASQFFCENDILTYSMLPKFGVTIGPVPALKIPVGGISGNNVTANMLWNPAEYDTVANQPGAGNQIDVYVNQWAPTGTGQGGTPQVTCTTNGTTALTAVSPVNTLLPGDWVIGAGANAADIPNVQGGACRIISNDGAGNAVLSKTATGSHTGVGLRFGYLSPITAVVLTVATLPPGIKGLKYFVSDANAPVFGSTVAGGGAVTVPVYFDGTNWVVG